MFRGFRQALRCRYPTRKSVRYFGLSNVRQNALKSQALPLPPAVSDEPLVESDFEQYLFPLYQNGWGMSFTTAVATKRTEIPVTALHRVLHFSSNKDVESFLSSTYDLCAQEKIFPNAILAFGHRLRLFATSPVGLTHSSIRAALLCETNYQKVVRSGAVFPFMNPVFKVGSITEASHLAAARLAEVRLAGDRYIPPRRVYPPCPMPYPRPHRHPRSHRHPLRSPTSALTSARSRRTAGTSGPVRATHAATPPRSSSAACSASRTPRPHGRSSRSSSRCAPYTRRVLSPAALRRASNRPTPFSSPQIRSLS
ncbi:hypothetical protein B0H10DRAFT_319126 [Mycena sp. CBHHK59/15]|nr:hypothetical protein B0H10DRAFT_319126 [Mycena sp. CBHHK59/15]